MSRALDVGALVVSIATFSGGAPPRAFERRYREPRRPEAAR